MRRGQSNSTLQLPQYAVHVCEAHDTDALHGWDSTDRFLGDRWCPRPRPRPHPAAVQKAAAGGPIWTVEPYGLHGLQPHPQAAGAGHLPAALRRHHPCPPPVPGQDEVFHSRRPPHPKKGSKTSFYMVPGQGRMAASTGSLHSQTRIPSIISSPQGSSFGRANHHTKQAKRRARETFLWVLQRCSWTICKERRIKKKKLKTLYQTTKHGTRHVSQKSHQGYPFPNISLLE